jgi:hypothetical protein
VKRRKKNNAKKRKKKNEGLLGKCCKGELRCPKWQSQILQKDSETKEKN